MTMLVDLFWLCSCVIPVILAKGKYYRPWRPGQSSSSSHYHDHNHASHQYSSSYLHCHPPPPVVDCGKVALNLTLQLESYLTSCPINSTLPSYINPKANVTTVGFDCANGNTAVCCARNMTLAAYISSTYVAACNNGVQYQFINQLPFKAQNLGNGTYMVAAVQLGNPAPAPLALKQVAWIWTDSFANCTLALTGIQSNDALCPTTSTPPPPCSACPVVLTP